MTRIAAITPAHREHLRRLKADFNSAYAAIEDVSDRSSPSFREAESLYRAWIKAIDSQALALLDDLDALDIGGGGPRPAAPVEDRRASTSAVRAGDIDHVFSEMEDMLHARDMIGDEEDDLADLQILSPPRRLTGGLR